MREIARKLLFSSEDALNVTPPKFHYLLDKIVQAFPIDGGRPRFLDWGRERWGRSERGGSGERERE